MITCGPYIWGKTLGKGGYATVKLAKHSETGQEVALKILRRKNQSASIQQAIKSEVEIMKELDHQNLIKILDFSDDAKYTLPDGRSMDVYYIALELAANGEIFDYLAETGRFSEPIARHYFRQLIEAVESMHKNGIFHRDIKPENIMLDKNFDLKVADFGFSSKDIMCSIRKGTCSYMAPEMHVKAEFKTAPVDIFAMGIVLFIMIKAAPPFNEAKANDQHYKLFCSNPDIFWKVHFKKMRDSLPSAEVVDLISEMLHFDPDRRITLEEIKEHEWFNGPLPTEEEILEDMRNRKQKMGDDDEMCE